jgi:transcriptional regulator with XRE-family HTH domain
MVVGGSSLMGFRYDEIGQRLKAYRMGSGLSADEIAKSIGISRTALYRFERGEVAKIDTLERLAELLRVSIPTLLGVGIEYIRSPVSYFERMRQIEETAEHIVMLSGPISFLLASDDFQAALPDVLTENVTKDVADPARAIGDVRAIMAILQARKELYRRRTPTVVNLMSAFELERFLDHGFVGRKGLPEEQGSGARRDQALRQLDRATADRRSDRNRARHLAASGLPVVPATGPQASRHEPVPSGRRAKCEGRRRHDHVRDGRRPIP